jgi:SAM-dependent methyltransferase
VSDRPPGRAALDATREFFGPRAEGWEDRFPDDAPRYERAIRELAPPGGGTALDAACGTGRALQPLRRAVGPSGTVLGVDVTPEMLRQASPRGRHSEGTLILADVGRLPVRSGSVDAVFAAGLLPHLPDPVAGLTELGRVCRPGGRLAVFHPIGRAALAARHGWRPDPGDIRREPHLRSALRLSGWELEQLDDGDDRYLGLARRIP